MKYPLLITLVASPLLLSACGGGGDDDPAVTPDRLDGKYSDAKFSGGLEKYSNITLKNKNNADIIVIDRASNRLPLRTRHYPLDLTKEKGKSVPSPTTANRQRKT